MSSLDPTLLDLARRAGRAVDDPADGTPGRITDLAVAFTGDLADLKAAGFVPRTVKRHPTRADHRHRLDCDRPSR